MEFTAREKEKAARTEAGHRKYVYKRLVEKGTKTREQADRGIAIMEAIRDDYKRIADVEEAQGRLL
jgi:hypothetical protein